ncbi:MAG: AIR synthase-related protein, partial [Pyrinomonadaceae bacterium]
ILGLASTGLHTNGYSLARKLFFDVARYRTETYVDELQMTVAEALLQPHLSYLQPLKDLIDTQVIKGLVHITGGGLLENIPRILPSGTAVRIEQGSWPILPVFNLMQEIGNVADHEMYRSFNMGLGMVIICGADEVGKLQSHLLAHNTNCYAIGEVVPGEGNVTINGMNTNKL